MIWYRLERQSSESSLQFSWLEVNSEHCLRLHTQFVPPPLTELSVQCVWLHLKISPVPWGVTFFLDRCKVYGQLFSTFSALQTHRSIQQVVYRQWNVNVFLAEGRATSQNSSRGNSLLSQCVFGCIQIKCLNDLRVRKEGCCVAIDWLIWLISDILR